MIKVYGRANSINVRKVLWMLEEVGETYEREDWGRGYQPTASAEFRRINPVGMVPVIDDGDFRLRESNTIVRYLATKHGRDDLYPTDLRRRAQIEAWMDWAATDVAEALRPIFHALVVKNPAFADQVEGGVKAGAAQMQVLDDHLSANGPFVAGASFTVGDIPVALAVNRWLTIPFDKPRHESVLDYYDRMAERPAFRSHGRNGTP